MWMTILFCWNATFFSLLLLYFGCCCCCCCFYCCWGRMTAASSIPFSSLYGLVINVPSRGIGAYLGGHHWYCLKRFANGEWFLLDSERQNAAVEKKTGSSSVSAPASAPAAASGTRASAAVQNAALKIDSVEDYVSNLLSSFKSASKNRAQLFLITVAEPAPK